jgi:hypothetical protein
MGKTQPEDRWRSHILELFTAFKYSDDFETLRRKGLHSVGRRKLFTTEEWVHSFRERVSNPEFMKWVEECEGVGRKYGLTTWTIGMACLIKDYEPEKQPFIMEKDFPKISLVTDCTGKLFQQWLAYLAEQYGACLIIKQEAIESTYYYRDKDGGNKPPPQPLTKEHWPSPQSAFWVRTEFPSGYPPEAAAELGQLAVQLGRKLMEDLGYQVAQRLRTSSAIAQAAILKAGEKGPLPIGGIYHIMDDIDEGADWALDQQRRSTTKSSRHRVKKRMGKYQQNE